MDRRNRQPACPTPLTAPRFSSLSLVLVLVAIASAVLMGCSPDPTAATNPQRPESSSGSSQPSVSQTQQTDDDVSKETVEVSQRTRIESRSPIDSMREGKQYRAALNAIDSGNLDFAKSQQRQLKDHPTYAVLSDAIEAAILANRGDYDAAMQIAEQISRVPIMQSESYMIAADVFRGQGRWGDAIGCLQQAITINPGLARAHRWLGILHYDLGAMRQATQHLRIAADADPTDFGVLRLSARIHGEYQNYPEAILDAKMALQRNPPPPIETELRLRLADSLRQLRKCDEAIEAIADCPESAEVWACRAQCWETAGDSDRAVDACKRALDIDPDNRIANLVYGRVLAAQREPETAIQHLERALAQEPSDHEAMFLLGRAMIMGKRGEEGKTLIERSTQIKERFLKIADLHLQALENPQDVQVRIELAELTLESEKPQIAAMWYRAVLGIEPNNPTATHALKTLSDN